MDAIVLLEDDHKIVEKPFKGFGKAGGLRPSGGSLTSGLRESAIHALMMTEISVPLPAHPAV